MTKSSKRRLMLSGPLVVIVIMYSLFSFVSYLKEIKTLSNQQVVLDKKYSYLLEDKNELKLELEKLKDPDYLARFARENYLYSKDGEYVIKIENRENISEKANTSKNEKPLFWLIIITFLSIVVYIVVKIKTAKTKKTI